MANERRRTPKVQADAAQSRRDLSARRPSRKCFRWPNGAATAIRRGTRYGWATRFLPKPRLDAIALLGALAACAPGGKCGSVRPAFASTPLRDALILAYQWCCLDSHVQRPHYLRCALQRDSSEAGGGLFEARSSKRCKSDHRAAERGGWRKRSR